MSNRWCFYIDATAFTPGYGYTPSIVMEDEPGHTPLSGEGTGSSPYYWGMTYETACANADAANADMGISKADALDIVTSSMRASR